MRPPLRPLPALALAALLAVPGALGGWSIKGAFEPDTPHDLDAILMRLEPDVGTGQHLVYFNGFPGSGGIATTTFNPNVATLGTSVLPMPFLPAAMFGVWRDCNGDGFVGLGDQGALEYSASLLTRVDICPVKTTASPAWRAHNDGVWVVEYVPIGYDDITSAQDEDALNINDTRARVWADWGLPEDGPGLACPTVPAPRGSFRSTGGMLRLVDCFTGFRGTQVVSQVALAAGQPELGFQDASPDRPDSSRSRLNRPNPWGQEGDAAIVRVFDCSRAVVVPVNDPTRGGLRVISDADGNIITLVVRPPLGAIDPTGSPAGTLNETEAGLTDCDRRNAGELIDLDGKDAGSDGDLPYAFEGGPEPTSAFAPRSRTDHVFTFEEGARSGSAVGLLGGPRAREHAGLGLATLSGFWVGTGGGSVGRNAFVSREHLAAEPVTHITYYAYVSDETILAFGLGMPGGLGITPYGLPACMRGVALCDGSAWWRDATGQDNVPRDARLGADPADPTVALRIPATEIGARFGQPYRMRDIDCIDQSIGPARAQNAHWGALTNSTCARP